jgi:hypothetical protein
MHGWPRIAEEELLARLRLGDEQFLPALLGVAARVGPRPLPPGALEYALAYPWARPPTSFLLDDGRVEVLDTCPPGFDGPGRFPLLAFGSNGAPERLALKLEGLPHDARRVLAVAGDLHGFDVGPSALPSFYGALPGTLFASPGTVVRATVLWVTEPQLTALAWTEVSYLLGRLDGVRFDADLPGAPPTASVLAFVSRLGCRQAEGAPVALAAVPAAGRTAAARTQRELLDGIAAEAHGGRAEDLVRAHFHDLGATIARLAPVQTRCTAPFAAAGWTRYPA